MVVSKSSSSSGSSDDSTSPPSTSESDETSSNSKSSSASNTSSSATADTTATSDTTSSSSGSSSSSSSEDVEYDDDIKIESAAQTPLEYFADVPYRMANLSLLGGCSQRAIVKEWSTHLGCWVSRQTSVLLYPKAFARGCMRSSYHLIDLQCPKKNFVAKQYRKKSVVASQYFDDVAMHSIAEYWAMQFNAAGAPKHVRFVPAAVLELPFLSPPLIFAIEPHLVGEFKKHNNNNGYVAEDKRNTPQSFSHYTFHKSQGQLLIVDIQGVGDDYTDPQIMSLDGEGYGRGNLGSKGMEKFLKTHQCNAVCEHLGLPAIAPKTKVARKKRSPKQKTTGHQRLPKSTSANAMPTPRSDRKPPRRTPKRLSNAADGDSTPTTTNTSQDVVLPVDPSPPQHLPHQGGKEFHTPNFVSKGKASARRPQRVNAHLRNSIIELRGDQPLVSVAPPPTSSAFAESCLMMDRSSDVGGDLDAMLGQTSSFGQWGTLSSFMEGQDPEYPSAGSVAAAATEGERRALEEEYQRLLERQARRKAEKDAVLVDDG